MITEDRAKALRTIDEELSAAYRLASEMRVMSTTGTNGAIGVTAILHLQRAVQMLRWIVADA